MATETEYGASATEVSRGQNAWSSESNANGAQNGTTAFTIGEDFEESNWLKVTMNNWSIGAGATINSVQPYLYTDHDSITTSTLLYRLSNDNGSTWCSSVHTVSPNTTPQWRSDGTCTHFTWTTSNIQNMQFRCWVYFDDADTGGGLVTIDSFRVIVTYTINVPEAMDTPSTIDTLLITRGSFNGTGGGTISHWDVWYSSTDPPVSYADGSPDILSGTATYQYGGGSDIWFTFKTRAKNEVGYSALSAASNSARFGHKLAVASNLRVKVLGSQITKASNLSIILLDQEIQKSSNMRIKSLNQILKASNLAVKVFGLELSPVTSNLRIKTLANEISKSSYQRVKALGQEIITPSNLAVKVFGQQLSPIASNQRIKILAQEITKSSNLRVLVWRADFTPFVTFNDFEVDDVPTGTTNTVINFGLYEGEKTLRAFAVDPHETTRATYTKYEMIYDVDPSSGSANYYHAPTTNGIIAGDKARVAGMDQVNWASGTTEIINLIDILGDGSGGSLATFATSPNLTGTVWAPPEGSGSTAYDVPARYNASVVVVVQPTDWDGNFDHKIHDWQPFQVNVGHAVELADFTNVTSGTHVDNDMDFECPLDSYPLISFRVYHEYPKLWEWYSGATLIDSGDLESGHTADVWDYLTDLEFGKKEQTGSYPWTLKLYTPSGSILDPNPVRIINVTLNVP